MAQILVVRGWRLEKFCRVVHLDVKQGQDVDRFGDAIPRISVVMWHKVANHCTAVWRGGQDEFCASSQDAVAFELRSRNEVRNLSMKGVGGRRGQYVFAG